MPYINDKLILQDWWDIPVEYHPTTTGKIIINIPGAGGGVLGKSAGCNLRQNRNKFILKQK